MKKLFPLALITVLGAIVISMSCQKNQQANDIHYCYCGYTDSKGFDSGYGALDGYSAAYSYEAAKKRCQKFGDSLKGKKPNINCYLE